MQTATSCLPISFIPQYAAKKPAEETKESKINALKEQLDKAVKEQNFERAAELRDEIKGLEA